MADDMAVTGNITSAAAIRVDGRVTGSDHRVATLIIGPHGLVIGDVTAREVAVAGVAEGTISASERVEVFPGAAVRGNVRTPSLLLRAGGVVEGYVSIVPGGAAGDAPADIGPRQQRMAAGTRPGS